MVQSISCCVMHMWKMKLFGIATYTSQRKLCSIVVCRYYAVMMAYGSLQQVTCTKKSMKRNGGGGGYREIVESILLT